MLTQVHPVLQTAGTYHHRNLGGTLAAAPSEHQGGAL
jgi:hypothetical protein